MSRELRLWLSVALGIALLVFGGLMLAFTVRSPAPPAAEPRGSGGLTLDEINRCRRAGLATPTPAASASTGDPKFDATCRTWYLAGLTPEELARCLKGGFGGGGAVVSFTAATGDSALDDRCMRWKGQTSVGYR